MKKLLVFSIAIAAIGASPAFADVDPKIAEFCLKAQDFQGCVNSMSGKKTDTTTTIRQIQQQGADIAEGNQCPSGFAYVGGGNCQNVICVEGRFTGWKNDARLAGKGWKCGKIMGIFQLSMTLGGMVMRTSSNPSCPAGEPEIGYNSTCEKPPSGWKSTSQKAAGEEGESLKCNFKLKTYKCSYNSYLEANPGMKKWADLNPELANKERVRLGSVD